MFSRENVRSYSSLAAPWLVFASSAAILIGIAPSQILLGLAILALILSGEKPRLPPIKLPLFLFLAGTVIAVVFSDNPAEGLPQIRKLYVFFQLVVAFTLLRDLKMIRWLMLAWAGLGAASAIFSFVQFAEKIEEAQILHRNFYEYYVGERVTGFMSHWYTFSAEEMFAFIMLASLLMFSPERGRRKWLWLACGVLIIAGLLIAEMRAVWIATFVASLYLIAFWKRWVVVAVPAVLAAGVAVAPHAIQQRFTSIVHPSRVDSNAFRVVTWRTGLRMIEAHPWLGLGPEMPRVEFNQYVPADIPRPLPEGSYIHLHDLYLQYAAERGIPTLLAFLWLLGKILADFWRGLRDSASDDGDRRFLLHGGIASVLAVMVDAVANVSLAHSNILTMFLVVVSCAYVAIETKSRSETPEPVREKGIGAA